MLCHDIYLIQWKIKNRLPYIRRQPINEEMMRLFVFLFDYPAIAVFPEFFFAVVIVIFVVVVVRFFLVGTV
ncbi:hypothetical protein UM89_07945 [Bacillus subtilis]|nr:hypothetical protein UM89_07945 [Bacillus subtilis]